MLWWHQELWMIDYGAALYFHHNWPNWRDSISKPFVQIKDHVLLKDATMVEQIDQQYKKEFTRERIEEIIQAIPSQWLEDIDESVSADQARAVYLTFLTERLAQSEIFIRQVDHARENLI